MSTSCADWIICKLSRWFLKNKPYLNKGYFSNFNLICNKVQIGDILLIEGHSRVSTIISHVTQSVWTHASLYIGRLHEIEDSKLREIVKKYVGENSEEQFLIESEIGFGTIITPITNYKDEHIRLLRPHGLTHKDAQKVINFAINRLGMKYDIRHLLDLARLLFPWSLYPRRWRSTLFQHNALQPTKDICSSMIADAFQSVDYPILPLVDMGYQNKIEFVRRNNRLYTPSDFDYSPYFDVLKYPFFPLDSPGSYHELPWKKDAVSDDQGLEIIFLSPEINRFFTSPAYAVVGATANRNKFGNKVLRCYIQKNKKVYPVNPHEKQIEGIACIQQIADLPENVKSISVVTPPAVTEKIVEHAIKKHIQNIWMQPGAESTLAIENGKQHNINVIANGPCILKELGFHE